MKPYSRVAHWIVLFLYITSLFSGFLGSIEEKTAQKAAVAGTNCTSPQWTWENPTPTGNMIYGSSAVPSSEENVFAVGDSGTILQYSEDKSSHEFAWRQMISQSTVNLKDVYVYDSSNVWAVGESGTVLKYNGISWTAQTSGTANTLQSVIALDQNNVWAVGLNGTVIKTTDGGASWSAASVPTISGQDLYTIAFYGDSMIIGGEIVTNSTDRGTSWNAISWLGTPFLEIKYQNQSELYAAIALSTAPRKSTNGGISWSGVNMPPANSYKAVEVDVNGKIWAAGINGTDVTDGVVYNYNGSVWSADISPEGLLATYSVVTNYSGTKAWFFGSNIYGADIAPEGTITWEAEPKTTTISYLAINGMASDESGNIWTVGNTTSYNAEPTIMKRSGTWSAENSSLGDPPTHYGYGPLNDVDALDSNNAWAVGDIVDSTDANFAKLAKRNSGTGVWESKEKISGGEGPEIPNDLYGVSIYSAGNIWASGANGTIVKSEDDGASFASKAPDGLTADINDIQAVRGSNPITVWAVGDASEGDGTILKTSDGGTTWENQTSGVLANIYSIYALDSTHAWAVGTGGTILRTTDGINWQSLSSGVAAHLRSVFALDRGDGIYSVYVVGNAQNGMSTVLVSHDSGDSWTKVNVPSNVNLTSVYVNVSGSETNVWVAGGSGAVLKYSKPSGNSATKLVMALPGQKFVDGFGLDPSSVSISQKAGVDMGVNIYAVDESNKLDITNGSTIGFSSSDPADANPSPIVMGSGTNSCGVGASSFKFRTITNTGWTVYANDISSGVPLTQASSAGSTILVTPGVEASTYLLSDSSISTTAGQPSTPISVGFKDIYGTVTTIDSGRTVMYSSSSSSGRFSTSQDGPWTSTLDITLSEGAASASAYYIDYVAGQSTITITPNGLSPVTVVATTSMGVINPSIAGGTRVVANPTSLNVGEQSVVTVTIRDRYGNPASGKSIRLHSSRSGDNITQPAAQTDESGTTTGKITSLNPGNLYLSAYDQTDGIWLEEQPRVTFNDVPVAIEEGILVSAENSYLAIDKRTVVIDKDTATISAYIKDQHNNPVANAVVGIQYDGSYGDLSVVRAITDNDGAARFVFTPKREGRVEFSGYTKEINILNKVYLVIEPSSFIDKPAVEELAQKLEPYVTVAAAIGLLPLIANIVSGAPAALHGINYTISLLLEALGIRRKRKRWGRVYDSTTGKGVDLALVRLYNQENMKIAGTVVTDLAGRYNFQPQPGTYAITVTKKDFIYPTQIFAEYGISKINKKAVKMESHYLGQPINISEKSNEFLNIDIPIDPSNAKPGAFLKFKIWLQDILYLVTFGLSYIFLPLLMMGTVLSLFVAIVLPVRRNILLAGVYLIITLIYLLNRFIKLRRYSLVLDAETNKPISGVVISIFDKRYNTLRESRVTDKYGRFSIYAQSGTYYLKAEKHGYEFQSDKLEKEMKKNKSTDKYWGKSFHLSRGGFVKYTLLGKKK